MPTADDKRSSHGVRFGCGCRSHYTSGRIFQLAKERDLDLDFHVDENGNEAAKGLLYVSEKAIKFGYQGRVVCGHCWCGSCDSAFKGSLAC